MDQIFLKASGLVKRFGKMVAVDDLSFEVRKDENEYCRAALPQPEDNV